MAKIVDVKLNNAFSSEKIDEIPTNLITGKLYKLIACNDDKEIGLKFLAEKCKDINNPTLPTKFFEPNGIFMIGAIGAVGGGYTLYGMCIVNLIKVKTIKDVSFGIVQQNSFDFDANGSPIINPPEFKLLETNNVNCCIFDYKGLLLACSEKDFNNCFVSL